MPVALLAVVCYSICSLSQATPLLVMTGKFSVSSRAVLPSLCLALPATESRLVHPTTLCALLAAGALHEAPERAAEDGLLSEGPPVGKGHGSTGATPQLRARCTRRGALDLCCVHVCFVGM